MNTRCTPSHHALPGETPGISPQKAPGGSPGTPRRGGSRLQRLCAPRPPRLAPRAFTLVELLVVIGIIGLLAALLTPVVMQSLTKARNAAIKAEIDMLHMAIMNYKNEYGSFPPCLDGPNGAVNKHILRAFPRTQTTPTSNLCASSSLVTPASAIFAWLTGFTTDPTDPIAVANPSLTKSKLFDFDQGRQTVPILSLTTFPYGIGYFPAKKPESTYIYINSAFYKGLDLVSGTISTGWPSASVSYTAGSATYSIDAFTYFPHKVPANAAPTTPWTNQWTSGASYFNPDTFQILAAGRDGIFGSDDDLSNFWPGTRREYLDSLKD